MSKRTKKSRSSLKVEALEQRQLLATIVAGSGENVADAQNVKLANGNTYDQVLMTGSTVTVGADAGQVTRIDFLDADGDITRVEFTGSGQLTVSLADFKDAKTPDNYVSTTKYVQGSASIRITGSDASTNVAIYSLGQLNVNGGLTNPIFGDGTKLGGNHTANVTRLVIEDDNSALGSQFGGIRAANAVFSGSTGAVGIVAPEVQFQGPIIIGDIDTTGNALPVLQIGQYSANKTVQIAGGDLKQTGGAAFITSNVAKLTVSSGQNSNAELLSTTPLVNTLGVAAANISYTSAAAKVVVDGKTVTAEQLTAYSKMYLNEVELTNWEAGKVFSAHLIGKVTVTGDLGGTITTDVDAGADSDADEFGIGDVTVTGKILHTGRILSASSIGNVDVGSIDLSSADTDAGGGNLIATIGRAGQSSAIGTVTVNGDVKLGDVDDNVVLVNSGTDTVNAANGGVGKITITGELSRAGGAASVALADTGNIGDIVVTKGIALASGEFAIATAGSVGNVSAAKITLTGAEIQAGKGVGSITATGTGASDDIVLTGKITASDGGIGAISGNKAVTISGGLDASKTIGAISAGGKLSIDTAVVEADEAIGTISGAGIDILSAVTGKSIGDITVTGDEKVLNVDAAVTASDGNIGKISVGGAKSYIDLAGGGTFTAAKGSIGDVTVAAGYILGAADTVEFSANKIGNVSVTAHKDVGATLLTEVIFQAHGITKDAVLAAQIGNITLDTTARSEMDVASSAVAVDANSGVAFSSSGKIGDITVKMGDGDGQLLASATTGLVFRAGNSQVGLDTVTYATGSAQAGDAVSIGNIDIRANMTALGSNAAGAGLVIAAGVDLGAAGKFVASPAAGGEITTAAKLANGTIGTVRIESFKGAAVSGFEGTVITVPDATDIENGASAIIADKIGNMTVLTGQGEKLVTPTGLPLKGVVKVGAATEVDDLYVVVL